MDRHFFKFWGEFLLKAAEGQRQAEEMTRWMQSDLPPTGELAALFRKCYGLPETPAGSDDDLWGQATAEFHNALKAYVPLWGWVSLDRYDELKRKIKGLQARVAEQERLIKQLETLLADENMGDQAIVARFQNLIADQSQAFDKLLQALNATPDAPDETRS